MNIKLFAGLIFTLFSTTGIAKEGGRILQDFKQNAEYELDLSVQGYFNRPASANADRDEAHFLGRFTMLSQAEILDSLVLGFNIYAAYSSQENEYNGVFREPGDRNRHPRYLDLNTFWLRYEADDFELSLGKDYIDTGFSELYSPMDRFGLSNIANPSLPYKTGVWHAGIDYFLADDTLSFKVIPIHEKPLLPSDASRWVGNTDDPQFTFLAANNEIRERHYSVRLENMGYLLQYKGARAGYDFIAILHHGPAYYPALHNTAIADTYDKVEPLAFSASLGVLKVYQQWTFNLEAIYQESYDSKDESFVRYMAGISHKFNDFAHQINFNEVTLSVQWSGDETVSAADSQDVFATSREARPFRNTVFVKTEFEQNDKWSYFLMGIHNVETDYSLSGGVKFKPNDNLIFDLQGAYFNGPQDTHFGRWSENDFIRFRTIYKF